MQFSFRELSEMHNGDALSTSVTGGGGHGSCQYQPKCDVIGSRYSSLFSEKQLGFDVPISSFEESSDTHYLFSSSLVRTQPVYDSCAVQTNQDLINGHALCLSHLLETTKEAEALRRENTHLRTVNQELNKQLTFSIKARVNNQHYQLDGSSSGLKCPLDIAKEFEGLSVQRNRNRRCDDSGYWKEKEEESDDSPTSVIEDSGEVQRFSLPKSISVRSNGYLKTTPAPTTSTVARVKGTNRPPRSSSPPNILAQKVYVGGGQKEEPLEMVVYNQGMNKTELCNKWQETGTCPYGGQCQFAHGIEELRPVIRHPRYKTEACRMVLAGVVCPYGHRCHFRHAISDLEKAIAQQPATPSRANKFDK